MGMEKDCLSCANSMSDDEDNLYCVLKQKFVEEDDTCEDHN